MLLYPDENPIFNPFWVAKAPATPTAAWGEDSFSLGQFGCFHSTSKWMASAGKPSYECSSKKTTGRMLIVFTNIQNNKHHLSPIIMHLHRSSSHHHQHQPNQPSKSAVILEMPQLIQLIVWIQKYTRQSQNLWQPPLEPESST